MLNKQIYNHQEISPIRAVVECWSIYIVVISNKKRRVVVVRSLVTLDFQMLRMSTTATYARLKRYLKAVYDEAVTEPARYSKSFHLGIDLSNILS